MDNLIRVYDGALGDKQCDYLIDMFDRYSALQEIQVNAYGQTLTRMNLMADKFSPFKEDLEYLGNVFVGGVRKYKEDIGILPSQWPEKYTLEAMKIKKYEHNGQDSFPTHVDVNSLDNCKRFLVMFIYLTDNEGGETLVQDFVSPCKKGSIIIFPPYWPWLHSGEKPIDTPKYILGSYLHYV